MAENRTLALPDLLMQAIALSENGLMVLDRDNRFIFTNPSSAAMFGFEGQSLLGQTHEDLMRWMYVNRRGTRIQWPTVESWLDYVHSRHRSASFRSFEVDLLDGRWLLVTEQICPGGEMIMLCSDITRQKDTEQALRVAQADLERLALTDELTSLPNRRNFLQQLRQEFAKSVRHGWPLCLAMLDLDHFKKVNDRYGHAAGDEVLKHFAQFMRQRLRVGDVVGRLGGEEFGILLPETELEDALLVLNRAAGQLAEERLDQVAEGFGYAFSGGLVQRLDHAGLDCSGLLVLADQALYDAKAAGRRQIRPYRWQ
ncbi:GGDEF domain-containing protein [Chitinimonas naiadis]